jgi:FGGY-family pentulose kinase
MGGSVSCEMSLAKITWLYKQEYYKKVKHLIELPEFLTWKATGSMRRSLCSLVCKWGYSPTTNYSDFLDVLVKKEDIPELMVKCGLDLEPLEPGCCVGTLTEQAASELGLLSSCVVGYPIIDAYAGAIGTILGQASSIKEGVSGKLGLICGTSSCHIVFTKEPMFVKGVWGPYPNVALSGYSCTEGGQSLTGKAIEIMLLHHPHFQKFTADCKENGLVLFDELNRKVQELSKSHVHMAMVAKDVHILPDFHGNRSPISDSLIRGTIVGMSMSDPIELYYYAVLLALCYGTRHIIDSLQTEIKEIYISGGMVRNSLWLQSLADVTGCAVITPKVDPDASVLLGSAMYARAAVDDLVEAMVDMSGVGQVITPNFNTTAFHGKKYQVFLQLYQDQLTYRHLMN